MTRKELKAFIGLHRVVNELDGIVGKIHGEYELTIGQFAVLEALYHKGDLCVGDLKDKILSSTGTIGVIINNLIKRDLIVKYQDEEDKRRFFLSLTPKGYSLIEKVYPVNEKAILEKMSVLSDEELDNLIEILKKLDSRR